MCIAVLAVSSSSVTSGLSGYSLSLKFVTCVEGKILPVV